MSTESKVRRHRSVYGVLLEHPFEVLVAIVTALIGVALLLQDSAATTSGLAGAPDWAVRLWQWQMAVGAPLTLLGLFWRGRTSVSLSMERAGQFMMSSAWGTRAVVRLIVAGFVLQSLVGVVIYTIIAAACLLRALAISRTLFAAEVIAEDKAASADGR